MADIRKVYGRPFVRIPIAGIRPTGWSVQFVAGPDELNEFKQGYWLSAWNVAADRMSVTFAFEPEPVMVWPDESEPKQISDALRKHAIETNVVKIG